MILERKDIATTGIPVLESGYLLVEIDFYKLIDSNSSGYKGWAKSIFLIAIGIGIKLILILLVFLYSFKTTHNKNDVKLDITWTDVIYLAIPLVLSIILYLIGKYIKNDNDRLVDKIKTFYKEKHASK